MRSYYSSALVSSAPYKGFLTADVMLTFWVAELSYSGGTDGNVVREEVQKSVIQLGSEIWIL